MFYDLHIHSALSPCADDEMTPNNIANMAKLKGLNLISITDHNAIGQVLVMEEVLSKLDISLVFGVEVQTVEEVHILCYFKAYHELELFYKALQSNLVVIRNDEAYFGNQLLLNAMDEVIGKEEKLLLTSVNWSLEELEHQVHLYHGAFVIAHALDRLNSITTQLGFIPKQLKFDGIEVKDEEEKMKCLALNPWIEETIWLYNSDAHRLIEIHDAEYQIDKLTLNKLWRGSCYKT